MTAQEQWVNCLVQGQNDRFSNGRHPKFQPFGSYRRVILQVPFQEGSRSLATDKITSNHVISTVAFTGLIMSTSYFQNLSYQSSSLIKSTIYWQILFNPCHIKRNDEEKLQIKRICAHRPLGINITQVGNRKIHNEWFGRKVSSKMSSKLLHKLCNMPGRYVYCSQESNTKCMLCSKVLVSHVPFPPFNLAYSTVLT